MGKDDNQTLKNVVGIAYHSPLDIITLVPPGVQVTLDPAEAGDVLFSRSYVTAFGAEIQVVFSSARELAQNHIRIVDSGSRGQILNLKQINWKKFLKISEQ